MTNKIRFLLLAFLCLSWTIQAQNCQSPITATASGITCNDNGTQLDSLDDTFAFFLIVTGDSTSWSIEPDSTLYSYDTTFNFSGFPISGGPLTLVIINTSDSLCTDTVVVTPPPPCSVPSPACSTPITAGIDSVLCNDNGTPLDSLDDTYTFLLTVTGGATSWSIAGDSLIFLYDTTYLAGPLPISAGAFDLIVVDNDNMACSDTIGITPPGPCSSPAAVCQTPISATIDSIMCSDNGTPLDSLDDTFTFMITVTGGANSWSVAGDSLVFQYDTTYLAGPFPINVGPTDLVLVDNDDMACTDTISIIPPGPCSVPPMCQTPITADFANILCNDNGTPLDSLDDTYTLELTVSGGATTWSIAGDTLMFPYDTAATVGPFQIGAGPLTLAIVDNADSLCMDTVMVTPPPPCSVPPNACDVKEIGCMKYELLGVAVDSAQRKTYTIMVTNNCSNKMIYAAFQVPDGVVAKSPDNDAMYAAPSGREYLVRNPNFSPMYSIRFKSVADSIADGQSDVFEYTLPAQVDPDYILVVTRVAPKIFYQAHLNTFGCKDSTSQIVSNGPTIPGPKSGTNPNPGPNPDPNAPVPADPNGTFAVYPNPTVGGQVMIDIFGWTGQQLELQLFSPKGELLKTVTLLSTGFMQPFELPTGLDAGIYWLKLIPANGKPVVQQLVIQW